MPRSRSVRTVEGAASTGVGDRMSDLVMGAFCACETRVRKEIGDLGHDLFLRVDIGGQSLAAAAASLGLETADARVILGAARRAIAAECVSILSQETEDGHDDACGCSMH